MFRFVFKKKYVVIFLNNKLFFTMYYIINKKYTFMYILHLLHKYGLVLNYAKINNVYI
jgi:hypothetical protein